MSTIRGKFQQNEVMKVDRVQRSTFMISFVEKNPDFYYANDKFSLQGTGNSLWDARRQEKCIRVEQRFTEVVWD